MVSLDYLESNLSTTKRELNAGTVLTVDQYAGARILYAIIVSISLLLLTQSLSQGNHS